MQYDWNHIFPSVACNKLNRWQSDSHQILLWKLAWFLNISFWSWHGFWIFRMILNNRQNAFAWNGRAFANLILKITGSDFAQMFLKDFFCLWNARRAALDAVPWACKENKRVCEKIYFHFFLGVREDSAMMFSVNGNGSRVLKTQIENTNEKRKTQNRPTDHSSRHFLPHRQNSPLRHTRCGRG